MDVSQDGSFEFVIDSGQLSKGLRPSKRMPRNSGYLTECKGAVGFDGVLQVVEEITRFNTTAINTAFPYPQIFVFTNCIIVCNQTAIYEWVNGVLALVLDGLIAGSTWSAVDFFDYVYLSNGRQVVVRDVKDAKSTIYFVSSTLPYGTAACNFNGQVLIGASGVNADVTTLVMPVGNLNTTATVHGNLVLGVVVSGTLGLTVAVRGELG